MTGADEYTHTLIKETLRQCDSNPDGRSSRIFHPSYVNGENNDSKSNYTLSPTCRARRLSDLERHVLGAVTLVNYPLNAPPGRSIPEGVDSLLGIAFGLQTLCILG